MTDNKLAGGLMLQPVINNSTKTFLYKKTLFSKVIIVNSKNKKSPTDTTINVFGIIWWKCYVSLWCMWRLLLYRLKNLNSGIATGHFTHKNEITSLKFQIFIGTPNEFDWLARKTDESTNEILMNYIFMMSWKNTEVLNSFEFRIKIFIDVSFTFNRN